jgi:hypothetical protein
VRSHQAHAQRYSQNAFRIFGELSYPANFQICNLVLSIIVMIFQQDCPNGKLDQKKFSQLYKQLYPQGDSKKFSNICFVAYDKDKNGFIGKT